ncbi:MAG: V-type ATPase 116kDa subunit family protein [Deltaproteobacteria bacterium]|jgi:V/A-type H+/Na+-transporting ATPase subunit I
MFKAVPLVLVNIQVAQEEISRATAVLTRLRIMHLINLVETPLGKLGYMGELERDLLSRYQQASEEVDRWAQALEIRPQVVDIPPDLDPAKDIYPLEEMLDHLRGQVSPVLQQTQEISEKLTRLQEYQQNLELVEPAGVEPQTLAGLRFAYLAPGWLPSENLLRLEQALEHLHHVLLPLVQEEARVLVLAAGLATDQETLDRALKGAFFEPLSLPPTAAGSLEKVLADLKSQIQTLKTSQQQVDNQRVLLRDRIGPELVRLRNRIDLIRTLLKARVLFGKVDRAYLVSGWIPANLVDQLKEALAQELGDQAEVEVLSPEAIPGAREGVLKIPILFNNPYLLRPFERLTTAYGTPAYGEVEPTAFLAVSFLLMFGLMFGDVGQGAVLFLLGYAIFHRFFRYTDYGVILMECGVASVIFGFLYGSVFGVENLLPALWFSPMHNITYFIKIAILFGVGAISLGLILGFINALRLKSPRLPAAGLLAALVYWIIAGLGVRYLLTGALTWDFWVAVGVTGVTLLMVIIYILQRLWLAPPPAEAAAEGRGIRLLEGIIEVVDGIIRFVANTISFIRIAAFALAHAGLFIAVFSLADTLSRMGGGGLVYWLTIVFGNVVIILLEGLVVSIQIVRLEYYEFMSKFFHGGGEAFKPLQRGAAP